MQHGIEFSTGRRVPRRIFEGGPRSLKGDCTFGYLTNQIHTVTGARSSATRAHYASQGLSGIAEATGLAQEPACRSALSLWLCMRLSSFPMELVLLGRAQLSQSSLGRQSCLHPLMVLAEVCFGQGCRPAGVHHSQTLQRQLKTL